MDKYTFERQLKSVLNDLHTLWLAYVDSVPEEGNEQGKRTAYLDISFFRGTVSASSTSDEKKLGKKYQIDLFYNSEAENGEEN